MLDIIVLSVVALLGVKGFFTGFLKEFFALIGIVGGVFLASRLGPAMGDMVNMIFHFESTKVIGTIGFVVVLVASWLGAMAVGQSASIIASVAGLGIFDRVLGVAFSGAKIFMIFSIVAYALSSITLLQSTLQKKTESSFVYPMLVATGGVIIKIDPQSLLGSKKDENTTASSQEKP
jgi:membrane protein required for colicin V production